ncbi:MAG: HD domain-containing phosphohydrolase [Fusobacteriota bacterium]
MEKVLVVDDTRFSRRYLCKLLNENNIETLEASNGKEALEILEERFSDILTITLDREMPVMNGFEFLDHIKDEKKYERLPIIIITAKNSDEEKQKGLELGVYDYLSKPIDPHVTYLKVKNAINFYKQSIDLQKTKEKLKHQNKNLEDLVEKRSKELENMTLSMITALENANLYNDESTGNHIKRVSKYSGLLASKIEGISEKTVKQIELYAALHDIGKIGIPDKILKKPGKFTDVEFEEMKKHTEIGYRMIKDSDLPKIAKNIIRYHHEKWNGSGYIHNLSKDEIPLEARIVAISDVFDALTTERIYKPAFSEEKAIRIIIESSGSHFDPELVDIFLNNIDTILDLKERYQ